MKTNAHTIPVNISYSKMIVWTIPIHTTFAEINGVDNPSHTQRPRSIADTRLGDYPKSNCPGYDEIFNLFNSCLGRIV